MQNITCLGFVLFFLTFGSPLDAQGVVQLDCRSCLTLSLLLPVPFFRGGHYISLTYEGIFDTLPSPPTLRSLVLHKFSCFSHWSIHYIKLALYKLLNVYKYFNKVPIKCFWYVVVQTSMQFFLFNEGGRKRWKSGFLLNTQTICVIYNINNHYYLWR